MIRTRWLIWFLFVFIFLSGCTGVNRDGPPSFYVDASKIPDAVPKAEKLSKYGNKPSYKVFGKRYYVMPSSKNYEERGLASWYGTKFHSKKTTNGERYDMLAMTAAHKTLPLPTYVQVTNLANGKKVIVKVNDRGPFVSNRLIDLSYVAAKKLGMLGHGTAYVDVKAINPEQPTPQHSWFAKNTAPSSLKVYSLRASSSTASYSAPLYIQAGAFRNRTLARKLQHRLLARFALPVDIIKSSHKHLLYRVQIGPVKDTASVKRIHQELRTMGIKL